MPASTGMRLLVLFYFLACILFDVRPLAFDIADFTTGQSLGSDGYDGEGSYIPAISPNNEPATVIVVHGLGGNGQEWAHLFLPISLLSLTYVKFILPTAPVQFVTYLNTSMPSWFDIYKLDTNDRISREDLFTSVDRIHQIVEGEIESGVPAERIFIMGFSQGGAVALTAFLRSKWAIAGCMAVATWLPLRNDYPPALSDKIRKKKILMIHGTKDKAIDISYARFSEKILKGMNMSVEFKEIKDAPHEVFTKEVLEFLEDFISVQAFGRQRALTTMITDLTKFFESLSGRR